MSEVKVKVSLLSEIQTGLNKVKAQFNQFRTDLNSSFTNVLSFGAIIYGLKAMIDKGAELENTAHRFAAPVEEIQRVTNVAREQGATITNVATAWNFLEKNRQKARDGSDEMRKHFADLGLTMSEVINLPIDQLFYRVADATQKSEDRGRSYAATVALMGRGAGILYSTLEKGSAVIKKQGDQIGVLDAKSVHSLHELAVEFDMAKNFIFKWGSQILLSLAAIPKAFGEMWGVIFNVVERGFNTFSEALGEAVHGHFIEAGKTLASGTIANAKDTANEIAAAFRDIKSPFVQPSGKGPVDEDPTDTKAEQGEIDKIAELRARLAEMQRRSSNDQLEAEERINALISQRAALLKEAAGEKDEEHRLNLQIDAAKITDEIEKAKAAREKEIADAEERLEKSVRDREYGELSTDAERRRFIQDEITDLNKMIAAEDDAAKKLDLETKREDDYKRLEGLSGTSSVAAVAADSLRRVGGGGNRSQVSGGGDAALHEAKQHTNLLKKIAKNTQPKEGKLTMQ